MAYLNDEFVARLIGLVPAQLLHLHSLQFLKGYDILQDGVVMQLNFCGIFMVILLSIVGAVYLYQWKNVENIWQRFARV